MVKVIAWASRHVHACLPADRTLRVIKDCDHVVFDEHHLLDAWYCIDIQAL
jgi:hypothetical protein